MTAWKAIFPPRGSVCGNSGGCELSVESIWQFYYGAGSFQGPGIEVCPLGKTSSTVDLELLLFVCGHLPPKFQRIDRRESAAMTKTGFALTVTLICLLKAVCEVIQVKRYGSVIGVKEEKLEQYKDLHANPWPEVNSMLKECNIRNYSIYLRRMPDGNHSLFSYFEYTGDEFEADMGKMAADPRTLEWWKEPDPCPSPLSERLGGEWWASMQEVYHLD